MQILSAMASMWQWTQGLGTAAQTADGPDAGGMVRPYDHLGLGTQEAGRGILRVLLGDRVERPGSLDIPVLRLAPDGIHGRDFVVGDPRNEPPGEGSPELRRLPSGCCL
jgi:hypothetical protein